MEKWIAGFLQAGGAFMFFAAGAVGNDGILLLAPALISGVSGLLLWSRVPSAPPAVAPREEPRQLEAKVDRIEDTLGSLQAEIAHLRDDREFFSELYSERAARPELKP